MAIKRVEEAIRDIKDGKMVILVDDEDRENEGDLTMAAGKVTPEAINFMTKFGRGLICLTLTEGKADELELKPMVSENTSKLKTAFTVSIDAKKGVTTGVSAYDRAHTILTAIEDGSKPEDLARPGHIFPLRARKGGVLVRTGQTEGSVDLARLAGLKAAGIICEIMKDDGTMARMPDLEKFAKEHNLRIVTIADIIEYRLRKDRLVRRVAEAIVPTRYGGDFKAIVYENDVDFHEHLAMIKGEINPNEPILVRVHSECLTGDVFGSERCDCGDQLKCAMKLIEKEVKQRKDSIEAYEKAGRADLAEKERLEMKVLQSYLPAQLSDEELEQMVSRAISQTGAASKADFGKVMGAVMSQTKGRADGNRVKMAVEKVLQ